MKTTVHTIAFISALLFSTSTLAQESKVSIKVPGFVRPLVEKLITEYNKENPDVEFEFLSAKAQDTENSLNITLSDDNAIAFARYAVLPVTTKDGEAYQLLSGSRLNNKKLQRLFFEKDEFDDEYKESKVEKAVHIYSGNSQQSTSRTYAASFDREPSEYKGKRISGDDSYLISAISRDPLGITINTLPNIYDLQSRQLRQELAIVPLDGSKQDRQIINEGSLDEIISLLERHEVNEIPVLKIGLSYRHGTGSASKFARWILTNGTTFVHEYGLLELPQKELAAQIKRATTEDSPLACL